MTTITIELPATITRKFAGYAFDLETAKLSPEIVAHFFRYGLRDINDYANSVNKARKDGGASSLGREDVAKLLDSVYDGSWATKASAGGGGDPVVTEMRKLALEAVSTALGLKKWEDIANHPKGGKYIEKKTAESSGKSYLKANNEALDAFAEANPKLNIRARAEAIVAARDEGEAADEVTL